MAMANDETASAESDATPSVAGKGDAVALAERPPISWGLAASFFLCALLLGAGLGISGMVDPRHANGFFNLFNMIEGHWDPSLALVFMSGLIANSVVYYVLKPIFKKPVFADEFNIPCRTDIDHALVVGSVLFGAGWAFTGFCPGPGLVAVASLNFKTILFVGTMLVGMILCKTIQSSLRSSMERPGATSAIGASAVALAVITVAMDAARFKTSPPMREFTISYTEPIVGGLMIGSAVGAMMILAGQVLGISGLVSALFDATVRFESKIYRGFFLVGLIAAGVLLSMFRPGSLDNHMVRSDAFYLVGGLLVGFGTCLGSGCTSGHGIAGLARLSPRSIVAVGSFFATNIFISTLLYRLFDVGSGWKAVLA
ncbi:UPF0394 membrane protein [Porphyridium purpureum]|uniref:UPF0394 membrane protein n=1 Tax=Porphyridium purpureum TaxID=35688 RepID=A0A5J4Z4A5_PORPP|nr:UPF0394 membrane protein [Porphyridium purpureum]|eukprot:POR5839..scf295_1